MNNATATTTAPAMSSPQLSADADRHSRPSSDNDDDTDTTTTEPHVSVADKPLTRQQTSTSSLPSTTETPKTEGTSNANSVDEGQHNDHTEDMQQTQDALNINNAMVEATVSRHSLSDEADDEEPRVRTAEPAKPVPVTDGNAEGAVPGVLSNSLDQGRQQCDVDGDRCGDRGKLLTETAVRPTAPQGSEADDDEKEKGEEEEWLQLLLKMDQNGCGVHQPESAGSSKSDLNDGEEKQLVKSTVQRPIRTCFVLCLAFFFVYTANLAIQNLQSSLHETAGLGITSLAVLYGAIIVFGSLSPLVIRFLTAKRTLVVAFVCHLLYTASNFYPTFPTLLTSSLLLGAMAGPMWTAQGLYATATGMAYAGIKQVSYVVFVSTAWENHIFGRIYLNSSKHWAQKQRSENQVKTHGALSLFNGVFFAFYESTQISGNLIASLILTKGSYNETYIQDDHKVCGAAVCPGTQANSTKIEQPEQHIVYILLSVYLACNIVGLLLTIIALPPLSKDEETRSGESSLKKSTTSCLSMLLVPKMLLLLPFFMAQAMNSGILLAEYNQKFVSCAVGIQWVGYVMTAFGVLTSAQAVGLNYAAKFLSRRVLFAAAALADLSVNVAMLLWNPTGTSVESLFILPCVSGFAEGIFQAQFNSLVAMVFPEQRTAAFATYHTSKATAFTLTFVLARFLCLNQRLYVSLTLSVLGLVGYSIVEVMLHRNRRKQRKTEVNRSVENMKTTSSSNDGVTVENYKRIESL